MAADEHLALWPSDEESEVRYGESLQSLRPRVPGGMAKPASPGPFGCAQDADPWPVSSHPSFFPLQLVKTHNLLTTRNYIFGYHPHGIMGLGAFCNFSTEATEVSKKFPGIRPYLATLAGNFRMPVLREYLMSGGETPWLLVLTVPHCQDLSLSTEPDDRLARKPIHHTGPGLSDAACCRHCGSGLSRRAMHKSSTFNVDSIFPRKPSLGTPAPCYPLHNLIVVHGTAIIPLTTVTPSSLIHWASQHLASAWQT